MKRDTHFFTQTLHKLHQKFLSTYFRRHAIFLNLCHIRPLITLAQFLITMKGKTIYGSSKEMDFYRTVWIGHIVNNNFRKTVRHGFILYMALAMLAVPSALCSQQHLMPLDILYTDLMADLPELPIDPLETSQSDECPVLAPMPVPELMLTTQIPAVLKEEMPPYYEQILKAAQAYDVDPALIRAVILAESGYNPKAVSKRGARGLMQLMPRTARSLGVMDSFDPAMNIDGGARYLRRLLDRFDGDVRLALAAYNAGSRHVKKYGGIPPFKATRQYIKKVLRYQKKFQSEMPSEDDTGSDV